MFLEAWGILGIMRVALSLLPFSWLTKSIKQIDVCGEVAALSVEKEACAVLVGKMIERAARYTPWESACLAQSLTARRMLAKRDIPGMFFLGVQKEGNSIEQMVAHAWTQCGNVIVTGEKGREGFTVVGIFIWGSRK